MRPQPQCSIEEDGEAGTVLVIRVPIVALPEKIEVHVPAFKDALNSRLSPREQEVYSLVMQQKGNKQIAAALHISLRTVKYHVSSILRKAHCETRAELWFRIAG
ncbi:MAG TPA: helix-turn-helix transcriptional regulator [Candidatus Acidoferrales bacterium]|nr:helix-turn-helix transcriptional regulator [Candidatus Acidoferrales bacterium]